jgi:hypothetical protein
MRTTDADGLLGETAHYGGDKSPSAEQRLAPLRELIDDRLLDALLERSRDEAGGLRLTGESSMLGELVKAVLERALDAELTGHLGYARHDPSGHNSGNSRNGTISKKVQTGIGPVGIEVPRDRAGDFEPRLVPKRSGRISGGLTRTRRDAMTILPSHAYRRTSPAMPTDGGCARQHGMASRKVTSAVSGGACLEVGCTCPGSLEADGATIQARHITSRAHRATSAAP